MSSTVTSGELKIIEYNVRGIGNKDTYVKRFLSRRKKKADIFCIVEHKQTKNEKLLEQFSSGNYKVGASDCRQMGAGGGVALLVEGRLSGVKDAENRFKEEFKAARAKNIEIAAVELNLKPKDCQNGLFVFGIYRRQTNKIPCFIQIVEGLIYKVNKTYKGTAIFTGDFNIDNTKKGQDSRSKLINSEIIRLLNLGYKFSHTKPSHSLGAALNNFLVPKNLKYAPKTLTEVKTITPPKQQKLMKEPDHVPVQIVVCLEQNTGNHEPQAMLTRAAVAQQNQQRENVTNILPSTSSTQAVRKSWIEENDVITILSDSDDEDSPEQTQTGLTHQNRINVLPFGNEVTLTRVKIEGERRPSRMADLTSPDRTSTTISQPLHTHSVQTNPGIDSSIFANITSIAFQQSSHQSHPRMEASRVTSSNVLSQRSAFQTIHTSSTGQGVYDPSSVIGPSRPLERMSGLQGEIGHSNVAAEDPVPTISTGNKRTQVIAYEEVQTVGTEPTAISQVQDATEKARSEAILQIERLYEQDRECIRKLIDIKREKIQMLGNI